MSLKGLLKTIGLKLISQFMHNESYNIDAIMKAIALVGSISRLAIETKVTRVSVTKWKNGKAIPTLENCLRIQQVTNGQVQATDIRPELAELIKILQEMSTK